ncbi:zinc-finger domain-containing protein [Copromyces sp. CBS 386.78]|nr:zinc-finger domain-containing protein [Copromyces sp. CBS 386.78]
MYPSRLRAAQQLSRQCARSFTTSGRQLYSSSTVPAPEKRDGEKTVEITPTEPAAVVKQAPNRAEVWSRSQKPRSEAMTGPRFEQTNFDLQPQPYSAMELIHKQPVKWVHERIVACDGGGGPAGHPKIYINTDKPEIATCNYCGLPFANEHNRKHLESLPQTSYPLQ